MFDPAVPLRRMSNAGRVVSSIWPFAKRGPALALFVAFGIVPLALVPLVHAQEVRPAADLVTGSRTILDAPAAERILLRQGFRDIDQLRRKGQTWIAQVNALDGRRMLAVVDAVSGEVTGLTPMAGPPIVGRSSTVRF